MMKLILILLFFQSTPNDVAKINALKKEAAQAYINSDFELAAEKYSYLVDSMEVMDDQILLNLGNAYMNLNDSSNAKATYNRVVPSSDKKAKSIAYQQLGVLNDQPENYQLALNYFKESLRADPTNEDSRYNYEVIKKKMEKKKNEQEQDQKDNQDKKDEDKMEPSEYAKMLKAQADIMITEYDFPGAFELMQQGLKVDETVAYYNDFISRIGDVLEMK